MDETTKRIKSIRALLDRHGYLVVPIIPTRGDVHLPPHFHHYAGYSSTYPLFKPIFVTSNTPFTRYKYVQSLSAYYHSLIPNNNDRILFLTQDDDCITDLAPILDLHHLCKPRAAGGAVVNAMTPQHAAQYPGNQTLIGFGALFHPTMTDCFDRYVWQLDKVFYRESDRIFATVNPHHTVFPNIEILACANNPNRYWRQAEHVKCKGEMEKRIYETTGISP